MLLLDIIAFILVVAVSELILLIAVMIAFPSWLGRKAMWLAKQVEDEEAIGALVYLWVICSVISVLQKEAP